MTTALGVKSGGTASAVAVANHEPRVLRRLGADPFQHVATFYTDNDAFAVMQVCKAWKQAMESAPLWRPRCLSRYPDTLQEQAQRYSTPQQFLNFYRQQRLIDYQAHDQTLLSKKKARIGRLINPCIDLNEGKFYVLGSDRNTIEVRICSLVGEKEQNFTINCPNDPSRYGIPILGEMGLYIGTPNGISLLTFNSAEKTAAIQLFTALPTQPSILCGGKGAATGKVYAAQDTVIHVCDIQTKKVEKTIVTTSPIICMVQGEDKLFVATEDRRVSIYALPDYALSDQFEIAEAPITSLQVHRGKLFAILQSDEHSIRIGDIVTKKWERSLGNGPGGWVANLTVHDEMLFAAGLNNAIYIWNYRTNQLLASQEMTEHRLPDPNTLCWYQGRIYTIGCREEITTYCFPRRIPTAPTLLGRLAHLEQRLLKKENTGDKLALFDQLSQTEQGEIYRRVWELKGSPHKTHSDFGKLSFHSDSQLAAGNHASAAEQVAVVRGYRTFLQKALSNYWTPSQLPPLLQVLSSFEQIKRLEIRLYESSQENVTAFFNKLSAQDKAMLEANGWATNPKEAVNLCRMHLGSKLDPISASIEIWLDYIETEERLLLNLVHILTLEATDWVTNFSPFKYIWKMKGSPADIDPDFGRLSFFYKSELPSQYHATDEERIHAVRIVGWRAKGMVLHAIFKSSRDGALPFSADSQESLGRLVVIEEQLRRKNKQGALAIFAQFSPEQQAHIHPQFATASNEECFAAVVKAREIMETAINHSAPLAPLPGTLSLPERLSLIRVALRKNSPTGLGVFDRLSMHEKNKIYGYLYAIKGSPKDVHPQFGELSFHRSALLDARFHASDEERAKAVDALFDDVVVAAFKQPKESQTDSKSNSN